MAWESSESICEEVNGIATLVIADMYSVQIMRPLPIDKPDPYLVFDTVGISQCMTIISIAGHGQKEVRAQSFPNQFTFVFTCAVDHPRSVQYPPC